MAKNKTPKAATKKDVVLDSGKRIRLGIWGLGRGMSFYRSCAALNIDVVAGCDFNEHMRKNFTEHQPDAQVTDDAEEFMSWDFDAVLLATFCPSHGQDALRALEAGKHVLSEVTSFHTMGEGVRLVEAVEKKGLVYNLAENYPFTAANMYIKAKYDEGLFGEFMYGEYGYVHEVRSLQYTYIDGVPIEPGHTVHHWRSWQNGHYYNTHSLGPMMHISGLRPTRVVSLPCERALPGYVMKVSDGKWSPSPSLISMSNGSVVRNLMGATTDDGSYQRIIGRRGSASQGADGLKLRLGGAGHSPKLNVKPYWPDERLAELAAETGHAGGDFWVLYYFAREIHSGEPAPFDIYRAADCTIPGILAYRSACENGVAYDVPDYRKKKDRDKWRQDEFAQKRYDTKGGVFPKRADKKVVGKFTTVMKHLIDHAHVWRAYADWAAVVEDMESPERAVMMAEDVIKRFDEMKKVYRQAKKIAEAHPRSDGGRVAREMLELGGVDEVLKRGALERVKKRRTALKRIATRKAKKK